MTIRSSNWFVSFVSRQCLQKRSLPFQLRSCTTKQKIFLNSLYFVSFWRCRKTAYTAICWWLKVWQVFKRFKELNYSRKSWYFCQNRHYSLETNKEQQPKISFHCKFNRVDPNSNIKDNVGFIYSNGTSMLTEFALQISPSQSHKKLLITHFIYTLSTIKINNLQ